MNRLVAAFCAFLALTWCAPAAAAISNPVSLGTPATTSSTVTTIPFTVTVDSPAGSPIIGMVNTLSATTVLTVADSKNNTHTMATRLPLGGAGVLWMSHADNPVDLPAPCTVTATETSTTLVIATLGTCTSGMSFGNGTVVTETITGGSFTGSFALTTPCSLASLPVTCAITGGATIPVGATATLSSAIQASLTGASKVGAGFVYVTGLATSSPLDITGAGSIAGTNPGTAASIATGGLASSSEIVFGRVDTNGTTSTFTQTGFTALPTITIAGNNVVTWGYQIVAASTTVTYATSWITSRTYGTNVYTFKTPSVATGHNNLLLLGVGE